VTYNFLLVFHSNYVCLVACRMTPKYQINQLPLVTLMFTFAVSNLSCIP